MDVAGTEHRHPTRDELAEADARLAELHARKARRLIEVGMASGVVDIDGVIAGAIREALSDRTAWCSAHATHRNAGQCLLAGGR